LKIHSLFITCFDFNNALFILSICSALREKLRDKGSNSRKKYLKLLVNEIRVDKKGATGNKPAPLELR